MGWKKPDVGSDDLPIGGLVAEEARARDVATPARSDAIVVFTSSSVQSESRIRAVGPDSVIATGSDAATVVQAAIDHAADALNGADVVVRGPDHYDLTSPITVREHVGLSTAPNTFLRNKLTDSHAWPVKFKPDSRSRVLNIACNGQQGLLVGEQNASCNIHLGVVNSTNAGKNYDGSKTPTTQTCIEFRGFNMSVSHIDSFRGNRGVSLNGAADVYIDSMLSVDATTGLAISSGCEHVYCPTVDIDSPSLDGVLLSASNDIHLRGSVWYNADLYGADPRYGLTIGNYGTCKEVRATVSVVGAAPTAVNLADIAASSLVVSASNASMNTATKTITTGIDYGTVADDVHVDARIDRSIQTPIAGTPAGHLNGVAYAAAGSGNVPPASDYTEHEVVENTDDNTVYIKTAAGSMKQL